MPPERVLGEDHGHQHARAHEDCQNGGKREGIDSRSRVKAEVRGHAADDGQQHRSGQVVHAQPDEGLLEYSEQPQGDHHGNG